MKLSYIKIQQRNETFFVTTFKAQDLKNFLNFKFREPYEKHSEKDLLKFQDYLKKINSKVKGVDTDENSVQRLLSISRVKEIAGFISDSSSNFLPNSVILSADLTQIEDDRKREELEAEVNGSNSFGEFTIPDNDFYFSIIDGQHRLAGLSLAIDEGFVEDFDIPAILLFDINKSTSAKLFADINGNQKPVSKSLIYDLYSEVDDKDADKIVKEIKFYQSICYNFYTKVESPLYKQIKMLGVGSGTISQAFFIESVRQAIKDADLIDMAINEIYEVLFYYFKAFQLVFPEDWPLLENESDQKKLSEHSYYVQKVRKSQLLKTNGFGAIMKAFPYIYRGCFINFDCFYNKINKLKDCGMDWTKSEGTGKIQQNKFFEEMLRLLDIPK